MTENASLKHAPVYSTLIVPQMTEREGESEYTISEDGKHRILPERGRKGMNKPAPVNLDWIYPDKEGNVEVSFAVYNAIFERQTPRDLHWSLAWPIRRDAGVCAWRQVHVVEERMENGPAPLQRYVYWGALTKSSGPTDDVARQYPLGSFSLAQRGQIEELGLQTPVMVPDGTWNCQDWLLDLVERMIAAGLISVATRDAALGAAGYGRSELWSSCVRAS